MIRFAVAVAFAGLLGLTLAPNARADEWNKKTTFTINEPIKVPNTVLSPGTYVMKLLDSPSDRHIVQIFNADENQLITTVLAIPNYRLKPTGKTVLQFYETAPGQVKTLRAWFYPGDNFGQEFAYPKHEAAQLASVTHQQVPAAEATPVAPPAPVAKQSTVARSTAPAPQQIAQARPTPAPAPQPAPQAATPAAPRELPKTGSPFPLIGLAGVGSLALFALVRFRRLS